VSTFGLISDLHSNLEAVAAVLQRLDQLGVQEIACLGDVVGYGADPGRSRAWSCSAAKWTILG